MHNIRANSQIKDAWKKITSLPSPHSFELKSPTRHFPRTHVHAGVQGSAIRLPTFTGALPVVRRALVSFAPPRWVLLGGCSSSRACTAWYFNCLTWLWVSRWLFKGHKAKVQSTNSRPYVGNIRVLPKLKKHLPFTWLETRIWPQKL